MTPGQQPATKQDLAELEQRLEQRLGAAIAAAENRTVEAMREMQTEILRGLEAFSRGNFARTPGDPPAASVM